MFFQKMCRWFQRQRTKRKIISILNQYDCEFIDFGPDSVGVKGDARVVGPVVYIHIPTNMDTETQAEVATTLINKVRGITRVLVDISPKSPE